VEIPKNTSPRAWRQHDGILNGASVDEGVVPQGEEERLVLHDRSAEASSELVIVIPVRLCRFPRAGFGIYGPVVSPGIRIQRSVPHRPHAGSMILIAAGPC